MNLFLSGASFLPSYGGPARSVSRLGIELANQGVKVSIWAPDGSAVQSPFLSSRGNLQLLAGHLPPAFAAVQPDLIHDNGLWLRHNHQLAQMGRRFHIPRVVSLRGMLLPIAFHHKGFKKKIAWLLYQRRDLLHASALHLTSDEEKKSLARFCLKLSAEIIPVGIDIPSLPQEILPTSPFRTAIFVGRLHPIKGLPLLIEAWARVKPHGWKLKIAGPDEAGYRAEVERLIQKFDLFNEIALTGSMEGKSKTEALLSSELFIMPSLSENFGLAIGEALAHGLPVITTTGTPWSALVQKRAGWHVPASVDGLTAALQAATSLPAPALREMGSHGRNYVISEFSWKSVGEKTIKLYDGCALEVSE